MKFPPALKFFGKFIVKRRAKGGNAKKLHFYQDFAFRLH